MLLAGSLVLAACGGSSSSSGGGDGIAGIGGTGIVVGKITNFGSIFVNGVEYNTDSSTFIVDDNPSLLEDSLQIGMVVKLSVETSNGELTSQVTEVVYDDDIQGPVAGITGTTNGETLRTFTVFGQTVTIDATKSIFNGTSFEAIANDDVVEVSGFQNAAGGITATYVEDKGTLQLGSEVEVRGSIANYSAGPPQSFQIDGFTVATDGTTLIDVPGGVLQNDQAVEVKGTITNTTTLEILADEIEVEDEVFDDGLDEVSLQGIITDFVSNSDFKIYGVSIDAGGAGVQFSPAGLTLAEGLEVEVEGDLVGGVLVADEVELREGDSRVEAKIQSVNTTTGVFEVFYQSLGGTVVVKTDGQTLFKDERDLNPLATLTLADLAADEFVRVEGQEVEGELIASIVKRIDDDGEFILEGAVDTFVFGDTITIFGIQFNVDGLETEYQDSDELPLTETQFFDELGSRPNAGVGTLVKIKDDAVVYGIADEVEFED